MPADTRDGDEPVLERLSQRFQDGARKSGQLVHEQHAAMGEGDLARPRSPSSDDRRRRRPVVWGAKGGTSRAHVRREQSRDRVDARHLERVPRASIGRIPPGAARASSCRCRVAPSAGGCASRPRRSRRARRARSWPRRSERSGTAPFSSAPSSIGRTPERRCARGDTRRPRRGDERRPARFRRAPPPVPTRQHTRDGVDPRVALPATASVPETGRIVPSSANSPTAEWSASRSGGSCLVAPSTASEMGRSKPSLPCEARQERGSR